VTSEGVETPRVWLLLSDKLGDNAQAFAIAEAVGWPFVLRRVLPKPEWVLGKPPVRPSLDHLDLERSDRLEPPWPDILITIGRRPTSAALWVREQSGGRTRIVLINRPKGSLDAYALVIVPSLFHVPPHPKVVRLDLPLMRADTAAVREAAQAWRSRFDDLPRPFTAVLVGGQTKPFAFDATVAARLAGELTALQARDGGTLYVTTSRRTQPSIAPALGAGLPQGSRLYDWGAHKGHDNPYLGLLGLADRFVVTGDSISMMVEVASLGRPLAIFPLPVAPGLRHRLVAAAGRIESGAAGLGRLLTVAGRQLGVLGYARDLPAVHRLLYEKRLAVPLGEPFLPPGPGLADELAPVAARIRALVP
jgi:mitochondrial fission protein ELM1